MRSQVRSTRFSSLIPGLIVHLKKPKLGLLPPPFYIFIEINVFFGIDLVDDFWQTYLMLPLSYIALDCILYYVKLPFRYPTQPSDNL